MAHRASHGRSRNALAGRIEMIMDDELSGGAVGDCLAAAPGPASAATVLERLLTDYLAGLAGAQLCLPHIGGPVVEPLESAEPLGVGPRTAENPPGRRCVQGGLRIPFR